MPQNYGSMTTAADDQNYAEKVAETFRWAAQQVEQARGGGGADTSYKIDITGLSDGKAQLVLDHAAACEFPTIIIDDSDKPRPGTVRSHEIGQTKGLL